MAPRNWWLQTQTHVTERLTTKPMHMARLVALVLLTAGGSLPQGAGAAPCPVLQQVAHLLLSHHACSKNTWVGSLTTPEASGPNSPRQSRPKQLDPLYRTAAATSLR